MYFKFYGDFTLNSTSKVQWLRLRKNNGCWIFRSVSISTTEISQEASKSFLWRINLSRYNQGICGSSSENQSDYHAPIVFYSCQNIVSLYKMMTFNIFLLLFLCVWVSNHHTVYNYVKQCCLFSKVESHKIDLGLELVWNFKEVQKYLQHKFFHFYTMGLYEVGPSGLII